MTNYINRPTSKLRNFENLGVKKILLLKLLTVLFPINRKMTEKFDTNFRLIGKWC